MNYFCLIFLVFNRLLLDKLLLDGDVEDYEYLNKAEEVDGVDDREEWRQLQVDPLRTALIEIL